MRPRRLELHGFSSFRDPTVVDFGDADMFVISGPTGSGKSSILDGIAFALYGSVPRYSNRGMIAPAINQGRNEAKVRLDFTVEGEEYSVVRVVQRTKTGATTKDAALERGSEVLTRTGTELDKKIEEIVGLTFDEFTKCILLPQGEFASFLKDEPRPGPPSFATFLGPGFIRN